MSSPSADWWDNFIDGLEPGEAKVAHRLLAALSMVIVELFAAARTEEAA